MTQEESLKNQKVIQSLLDDIKTKAEIIKKLEKEIFRLKGVLKEINNLSDKEV